MKIEELQQAVESVIRDVREADALFEKIESMAVREPPKRNTKMFVSIE